MLNRVQRFLRPRGTLRPVKRLQFIRPLVVLQSDDWGRVGIRDRDGYEQLRAGGIGLGEHPYDFYTLETADDVYALRDVLRRHRDSTGRAACLVMNFLLANLDFGRIADSGFREIHLKPLHQGLPEKWKREGLFEAYRSGIADGVFYPGLHGLTHFCRSAVERRLLEGNEHGELLRTLWKAQTPYIYWRMPWVGYEYCNPERPQTGFADTETQKALICQAAAHFRAFFSTTARSACAPGYRANRDTHLAWSESGVRVAQNGSGAPLPPHMDEWEILNLYRTIDFEPAQRDLPVGQYVQLAEQCFARGVPAIVSVHSINFHSTIKNFRGPTLQALDNFLSALKAKYPNLLYVHDRDLYEMVTRGTFTGPCGKVSIAVKQDAGVARRNVAGRAT